MPIAPPQRTKMGPQRRLGIYVGFDSPSIIRYLEPLTFDVFTARFPDCHFDETNFPQLGERRKVHKVRHDPQWKVTHLSHLDPRTSQSENEVRRIVHLQQIVEQLPDVFINAAKVTKSYIPAANISGRVIVHKEQLMKSATEELSVARQKLGRPIGSKDSVSRKRKMIKQGSTANDYKNLKEQIASEKQRVSEKIKNPDNAQTLHEEQNLEKAHKSKNSEISVDYTHDNILKRYFVFNETKYPERLFKKAYAQDMAQALEVTEDKKIIINDMFAFTVTIDIVNDHDPQTIDECRLRHDWLKWKEAIQAELTSLAKREVFGPVV